MRRLVSLSIHEIAFATGLSPRLARGQRVMRIVMYHGIGPGGPPARSFEAHLRFLKRHFEVVSLDEMIRRSESPGDIRGREVALTFDDGLRNNYDLAWPLLRGYGVPATFFVCPALIDDGRWLWTHELRARLASLDLDRRRRLLDATGLPAPERGRDGITPAVEAVKGMTLGDQHAFEATLRQWTGDFVPTSDQRRKYDLMSWDELRALDPEHIRIGSHSASHPILPTLSDDALEAEIAGSRRRLEAELGREIDCFCYPNGAEDERVRAGVARSYRSAVTTRSGTVSGGADRHRLPRIGATARPATLAWRFYRP